jgi:hypothetical protein
MPKTRTISTEKVVPILDAIYKARCGKEKEIINTKHMAFRDNAVWTDLYMEGYIPIAGFVTYKDAFGKESRVFQLLGRRAEDSYNRMHILICNSVLAEDDTKKLPFDPAKLPLGDVASPQYKYIVSPASFILGYLDDISVIQSIREYVHRDTWNITDADTKILSSKDIILATTLSMMEDTPSYVVCSNCGSVFCPPDVILNSLKTPLKKGGRQPRPIDPANRVAPVDAESDNVRICPQCRGLASFILVDNSTEDLKRASMKKIGEIENHFP